MAFEERGDHAIAVGGGLPEHPIPANDMAEVLAEQAVMEASCFEIADRQIGAMTGDHPSGSGRSLTKGFEALFDLVLPPLAAAFLDMTDARFLTLRQMPAGHLYLKR